MCVDLFFFSSRRRHTRYWRDWSSDVCSSDLSAKRPRKGYGMSWLGEVREQPWRITIAAVGGLLVAILIAGIAGFLLNRRSEERRVGKEGRSRRSPYY